MMKGDGSESDHLTSTPCWGTRATARVSTPRPLCPRSYNDDGGVSDLDELAEQFEGDAQGEDYGGIDAQFDHDISKFRSNRTYTIN
jgi:hypothetical protein